MNFSGLVSAEIGEIGAIETALFVDGGVDLGGRKNEPIFAWLVG